ncbi:MaoC family dehydratase [Flammeovirga yaeyamensis]|uniref:MaoC family dehydratase n=1 Tax=Flammeovirga yaeyamensis TaxID=367791 RepID=A0AAX1N873_9BACT|nr:MULTISPECIES: MaoC family dehydratase [Flammeovirga]ANQ48763.1 MaoC family dehydratase [Flammeovirga sp. MY04]MBB3698843.1 acyl dehydratase [Flammeovirga yaeyamensis]NMF37428.1 MaoC family dehydratase [Flammeovirga yaeyamensis]QWG03759.1 MaoC family dehydratase [Flammeovirga yaeyamensis]
MLEIGQSYQVNFKFTQEEVNAFAQLTGDTNPIHIDEEFAAQTPFKKPIIHGFLSASIFSRVLGTEFPGNGSVYLSQTMDFLRPMFVEETYSAEFEISEIDSRRKTAVITTVIKSEANKVTVKGSAKIMHKTLID